jgi:hypothetical protein
MTLIEILANNAESNLGLVRFMLADFSDADMVARAAPNANHAAWQVGHMMTSEVSLLNQAKAGAVPELPASFVAKFTKETARVDDPKAFPPKGELLNQFEKVRQATVKWIRSLSEADCNRPMPEKLHAFAKTWGELAIMMPVHTSMHVGQIQVIRRKLGKPVLF